MRSSSRILLFVVLMVSAATLMPFHVPAQAAPTLRYLGFSPATPPADSLVFRQAIAHAIDRESIVKAIAQYAAIASPAHAIQHPRLPGYNPAMRGYPYDPAKARELYAQSGWTGPITIMIPGGGDKFREVLNNAVADSLRKALGATVTMQATSFNVLVDAVKAGRVAIYMLVTASDPVDFGYPSIALGLARETNVPDPEVKGLVEKGDAMGVERMLLDKALIVPIIHY